MLKRTEELPDAAVACVGGGSNPIGLFDALRDDATLYGAEGGGKDGNSDRHAAPLAAGEEDIIHEMKTRVIDDDVDVHSVSAGLDYPGVGTEHAMFRETDRAEYHAVTDEEAPESFRDLSRAEGIIRALETAHCIALAKKAAEDHDTVLVNLSGTATRIWIRPPRSLTSKCRTSLRDASRLQLFLQ